MLSRSKHWLSPPYWPFGYWGNTEKVLRETPPSCINLPAKSFPFSEKVFMPPSPWGKVAILIFRFDFGQLVGPTASAATTWSGPVLQ